MKIQIVVELSSKSEEGIKGIKEVENYIRSGKFQRDMEDDKTKVKCARCKATVEVLED